MALKLSLPFKRGPRAPRDPEGRMTLFEHLAELRGRLFKAALAIVAGVGVAWFFHDTLFQLLQEPFTSAATKLAAEREFEFSLNFADVGSPLLLNLKICAVAALMATSPVWLYQIWAFITPGLHRNERKWTYVFVGTAAPLFIGGVLLGYYALPKGLGVLLDFTPAGASNFVNVDTYLSFIIRLLLVFGAAFEIPIFVVVLNVVGVLSSKSLRKARPFTIFGIFVFAAVATPSTDPFTMLLLALPMTLLYVGSEFAAFVIEGRRRRRMKAMGIDTSIDIDD